MAGDALGEARGEGLGEAAGPILGDALVCSRKGGVSGQSPLLQRASAAASTWGDLDIAGRLVVGREGAAERGAGDLARAGADGPGRSDESSLKSASFSGMRFTGPLAIRARPIPLFRNGLQWAEAECVLGRRIREVLSLQQEGPLRAARKEI